MNLDLGILTEYVLCYAGSFIMGAAFGGYVVYHILSEWYVQKLAGEK